jgi:hypothetical protein
VLEVRDLACVKINEPKPRPSLIMYQLLSDPIMKIVTRIPAG